MQNPFRGPSATACLLLAGFHSLCLPMEACPKAGDLILSSWEDPRRTRQELSWWSLKKFSLPSTPSEHLLLPLLPLASSGPAGMPGWGSTSNLPHNSLPVSRCGVSVRVQRGLDSSLVTHPHSPVLWSCSCAWEYLLPNLPLHSLLLHFHHFPKPSEMTRESNTRVER